MARSKSLAAAFGGRTGCARPAVGLLVVAVGWLSWELGSGLTGLGYLSLLALWAAPGVPIGAFVFGGRHPAAWLAGAALGYPLSALLLWLPIALGTPTPFAFAISWLTGTLGLWAWLWRRRRARVELPPWSSRDTVALSLVLLLVPVMTARPFLRIGEQDASGSRYYRAYFTADFVWHMALTAELERFSRPPANPYLAGERLNYYWLHFVPAAASTTAPVPLPDRVGRLTINALGTDLYFVAAIFLFAWVTCGGRAGPAGAATALAIAASSAEGLYLVQKHLRAGVPLAAIREINVDAVTSWYFGSITVDGLQRAFMYNPHHALASGTGLIALVILARAGASMSAGVAATAGVALALALALSPFPGGVLAVAFAIAMGAGSLGAPRTLLRLAGRLTFTALPILASLAWCVGNRTFEGAGGDLAFGLYPRAATRPISALAWAVGPVLLPALVGLALGHRRGRVLLPAVGGLGSALAIMFLVHLKSVDVWTGWRAGQVLLVTAPALGAVALAELSARSTWPGAVFAVAIGAAGVPTTVLDIINAQDVGMRRMGPGFAWTVEVTRSQQAALDWIRTTTPRTAIVQMEPTVRGRETWSLIPSFAERRMAAGLPISLLNRPEYGATSERVRELYAASDAERASSIARELGINYLYLDDTERRHYPDAGIRFGARPDLFMPVFVNDEAQVYFVQ